MTKIEKKRRRKLYLRERRNHDRQWKPWNELSRKMASHKKKFAKAATALILKIFGKKAFNPPYWQSFECCTNPQLEIMNELMEVEEKARKARSRK